MPMNKLPKYVASATLHEPLSWQNSSLLPRDLSTAVRALKEEDGDDLHVIGSPGLVQALLALGLIDELSLMIGPVLAGGGKRLFGDDGARRRLRLTGSQVTAMGAIIATYTTTGNEE
jgi:dihydrofolate reductase